MASGGLLGQQQGVFSQQGNGFLTYNPGFTGAEKFGMVSFGQRAQWVGFKDAPVQQYLNYSTRLRKSVVDTILPPSLPMSDNSLYEPLGTPTVKKEHLPHGLGIMMLRDEYGPFSKMSAMVNYAHHFYLNGVNLGAGIGIGATYTDILEGKLSVLEDGDELYNSYIQQNALSYHMDASFGAVAYNKNFYVGYSISQMLLNKPFVKLNEEVAYQLRMHHMLNASYVFRLSKAIEIAPTLDAMTLASAPSALSIGCKARLLQTFWGAFNYRFGQAINTRIGFKAFNHVIINYSYEWATTAVQQFSSGTHEIGITITFNSHKTPKHLW